MRLLDSDNRVLLRIAIAAWILILTVISIRVLMSPRANSVYPIFAEAGRSWRAGESLYPPPTPQLDQFRYAPTIAVLFSQLSLLPDPIGGTIWRWINAALLFAAIWTWCQFRDFSPARSGLALLLALPLAVGGLNNGQCNALLAGLAIFAALAVARERFWFAALCITVAVLFKGYQVALGLLLCLVEPR